MQNLDDKYIFDRVKSVLEDYEPDYQPESWTKLSGRLDRCGQTAGYVRWKIWLNGVICGALLVGSIVGVYLLLLVPDSASVSSVDDNRTVQLPDNPYSSPVAGKQPDSRQQLFDAGDRTPQRETTPAQLNVGFGESIVPVANDPDVYADGITNNELNARWTGSSIDKTVSRGETESNSQMGIKIPIKPANSDSTILPNQPSLPESLQSSKISGDSIRHNLQDSMKSEKKKKCFDWSLFKIDWGLNNEGYRKFVGADRLKFGYSPEIVFGNFQDKAGWSNGVGLMVEGPLSSRIMLGAGLSFRGYSWQKTEEYGHSEDDSITFPNNYMVDSILLRTGHWRYFEIPVELGLVIASNGRWSIGANISIAAQIMQSERYTLTKIADNDTTSNTGIPDVTNYNLLGSFGIGLEYRYRFGERWSLWVEPYYKFQLKSIGASDLKPGRLGINAGIVFQFNLHRKKQNN